MIRDVAFPKARLLRKGFSFKYAASNMPLSFIVRMYKAVRVELSMDKKAVSPDSSTQITGKCKKYKKKKHKHRWKIVSNMNKLVVLTYNDLFRSIVLLGKDRTRTESHFFFNLPQQNKDKTIHICLLMCAAYTFQIKQHTWTSKCIVSKWHQLACIFSAGEKMPF